MKRLPPPDATPATSQGTEPFHFFSFILGVLTATVLVGGTVWLLRRPEPAPIVLHPPPTPAPTSTLAPTSTPAPITVFVSGAVLHPGLYELPSDSRAGHALVLAGGLTADADAANVNQAARLVDGAQVYIPTKGEAQVIEPPAGVSGVLPTVTPLGAGTGGAEIAGGLINLNTATAAELESLPGIGPARAQDIMANRPYASVDDLERVPGIGPATMEQLRTLVVAP